MRTHPRAVTDRAAAVIRRLRRGRAAQAMSLVDVTTPELGRLLAASAVDRWVAMDTYWGRLPQYYDNL